MKTKVITIMLTLFVWLSGCVSGQQQSSDSSYAGSVSHNQVSYHQTKETIMTNQIVSGEIPKDLDIRVQNRDTKPLPKEALVKFQVINRGLSPHANYRWLLYEDGRLFIDRHSGSDSSDYNFPFDRDFPSKPTKKLPAKVVNHVKQNLIDSGFLEQPPYQLDNRVEDGTFYVVTARISGRIHEVIYEAFYPPLVEFLETIESM